MTPSRPPGLRDVAKLAGVSHQTVSRVINGSPRLRPETRARVEAAIDELGYRPNLAARALVTNRSHLIGVIVAGPGLYGPSNAHEAVAAAAKEAGWFCGSVRLREMTDASLAEALDYLAAQRAAGIVIIAGERDVIERVRRQRGSSRLVVVGGDLSGAPDAVGVDSRQGAYDATRHLLDLGHRVVGHVTGPLTWAEATARRDGWLAALADEGLRAGPELSGDWTAASGHAAGKALVESAATALLVANDEMAIGVLRALHEAGREVPGDMSVVGFDDIPGAEFLCPPLTTVSQQFSELGRRVIALIAGTELDPDSAQTLVLPQLIIRDSSGPVPR